MIPFDPLLKAGTERVFYKRDENREEAGIAKFARIGMLLGRCHVVRNKLFVLQQSNWSAGSVVMYWYLSNQTRGFLFGPHLRWAVSKETMPFLNFTLRREHAIRDFIMTLKLV